jgi:hypothetical protein
MRERVRIDPRVSDRAAATSGAELLSPPRERWVGDKEGSRAAGPWIIHQSEQEVWSHAGKAPEGAVTILAQAASLGTTPPTTFRTPEG